MTLNLDGIVEGHDIESIETQIESIAAHFREFREIKKIKAYIACNHAMDGRNMTVGFFRYFHHAFPHVKLEVTIDGDVTINPPGVVVKGKLETNPLRYAKQKATLMEQQNPGMKVSSEAAEDEVIRDPTFTNSLVYQWYHIADPTMTSMRKYGALSKDGVIAKPMFVIPGNDYDKGRRWVIMANLVHGVPLTEAFNGLKAPEQDLMQRITSAEGFESMRGINFISHGRVLEINFPYLRAMNDGQMQVMYRNLADFLDAQGRNYDQLLLVGHQVMNPLLRREKGDYFGALQVIDKHAKHLLTNPAYIPKSITSHAHRNPLAHLFVPPVENFVGSDGFQGIEAHQIGWHEKAQEIPEKDREGMYKLYGGKDNIPQDSQRIGLIAPTALNEYGVAYVQFRTNPLPHQHDTILNAMTFAQIGTMKNWGLPERYL